MHGENLLWKLVSSGVLICSVFDTGLAAGSILARRRDPFPAAPTRPGTGSGSSPPTARPCAAWPRRRRRRIPRGPPGSGATAARRRGPRRSPPHSIWVVVGCVGIGGVWPSASASSQAASRSAYGRLQAGFLQGEVQGAEPVRAEGAVVVELAAAPTALAGPRVAGGVAGGFERLHRHPVRHDVVRVRVAAVLVVAEDHLGLERRGPAGPAGRPPAPAAEAWRRSPAAAAAAGRPPAARNRRSPASAGGRPGPRPRPAPSRAGGRRPCRAWGCGWPSIAGFWMSPREPSGAGGHQDVDTRGGIHGHRGRALAGFVVGMSMDSQQAKRSLTGWGSCHRGTAPLLLVYSTGRSCGCPTGGRRGGIIPVRSTLNWTGDFRGSACRARHPPSLANRYGGQKRALTRKAKRNILIAALAVPASGFMAWVSMSTATDSVSFKDIGYSTPDATWRRSTSRSPRTRRRTPNAPSRPWMPSSPSSAGRCVDIGPNAPTRRGRRPDHGAPHRSCARNPRPSPPSWTAAGSPTAAARQRTGSPPSATPATRCDPHRSALWFIHRIDYNGSIPFPR